jgi:cell division ATPase FtsA
VLTGGTALLPGIGELAEQVFDLPVRIGRPTGLGGLSDVVADPRFATGAGLLRATAPAVRHEDAAPEHAGKWSGGLRRFRRAVASFI